VNAKLGKRLIEISKALKPQKATGSKFHCSFAIRQNKIACIGWNDYNKPHCEKRFGKYENHKGFETEYRASRHAESHLLIRLGEENLDGYEIVNVRISNNNEPIMSRPCINCARMFLSLDRPPRKVFYSDNSGEIQRDDRF
jgi:deoxycytidylate deaminase